MPAEDRRRRIYQANFDVYGVRKVWRQMRREGLAIARCTVAQLISALGLQCVIRSRPVRTTESDKAAPCPLNLVNRQSSSVRPNALWLSNFTYDATWKGFVCVAYFIDAYACCTVGWRVSRSATPSSFAMPWSRLSTSEGQYKATASSIILIGAAIRLAQA